MPVRRHFIPHRPEFRRHRPSGRQCEAEARQPLIDGANWAARFAVNELNLTSNRRGGNATTYHWRINATKRGGD